MIKSEEQKISDGELTVQKLYGYLKRIVNFTYSL